MNNKSPIITLQHPPFTTPRSSNSKSIVSVQDIDFFDIPVSFLETKDADENTDIIRNCKIKKINKAGKSGDTKLESELELLCSHIDWNE